MKLKYLAFPLLLSLTLGVVACGEPETETEIETPAGETEIEQPVEDPGVAPETSPVPPSPTAP